MGYLTFTNAAGAAFRALAGIAVFAGALTVAGPGAAQQQGLFVVGNDRGGLIGARADEIARLSALGTRVEIRGNICYSSCTMYLGASDVCISPSTSFGFHGPSQWGAALPPDRFDHWSRVMARFYNEPLRRWFMEDARFSQQNYKSLSGTQLISLGYAQC